jgi:hypothetical protein
MRRPVVVNPFLCNWDKIHLLAGLNAIAHSRAPAAAAAFGLTQLDHFVNSVSDPNLLEAVEPVQRSLFWILAASAVLIFFVGVLGPGIRFP